MLGVLPHVVSDYIDKGLGLAQASIKKGFKFFLDGEDVCLVFYLTLIMLPAEQGGIFWKSSCKQNSVWPRYTGGGKVVFALLEEIITLYVGLTLIHIRETCFQRPLMWAFIVRSGGNDGSRNRFRRSKIQNCHKDLLEVNLQVFNDGEVGRAWSSKESDNRCNSGSRSTCCDKNRGATFATLVGDSASKLVFAVKRKILAKTMTSKESSHWAG